MKLETIKNFLKIIQTESIITFARNKNQQKVNKLQMYKINQHLLMERKLQLQKEETTKKNQPFNIQLTKLQKQKKKKLTTIQMQNL